MLAAAAVTFVGCSKDDDGPDEGPQTYTITFEGDDWSPLVQTQQLCAMTLRSFGLAPPEAELIAAQAANAIIRPQRHEADRTD